MADNAYTKMSLGGQLGVSAALAIVIGGLFWYFYWDPAVTERDEKAAKLEALNKEIRALEVTAQKLGEFQREVALLEKKLETLKSILPPAKETPDLMRKVQALAAQSNLTINNFTPGATVNKDFYQESNNLVNFQLSSTFSNPEVIIKQQQNATKPVPGASPAAGAPPARP